MIQFFNKKMSKKRKGFTLIELIVVIAILGILAAIAIPRFTNVRAGAESRALEADARVLTSAAQLYAADEDMGDGAYPEGTDASAAAQVLLDKDLIDGVPEKVADLSYADGIFTVTAASGEI